MLASDDNNVAFTGAKDPDAALAVEFYIKPVQNMFKTSKEGRPIYEDVIYVRINVPGMKEMQVDRPALSEHQQRFPRQWQYFMNRTQGDAREIGTPLAEWPVLTRSQAEELRSIKFFTVESIANASDLNLSNIGMMGGTAPHALREKAKAFLKVAQDAALPQFQAEELAKRDAEILALKEDMKRLAATIEAKPATAPVVEKQKKTLSPEHLAKLAAGRAKAKAAKERKSA